MKPKFRDEDERKWVGLDNFDYWKKPDQNLLGRSKRADVIDLAEPYKEK